MKTSQSLSLAGWAILTFSIPALAPAGGPADPSIGTGFEDLGVARSGLGQPDSIGGLLGNSPIAALDATSHPAEPIEGHPHLDFNLLPAPAGQDHSPALPVSPLLQSGESAAVAANPAAWSVRASAGLSMERASDSASVIEPAAPVPGAAAGWMVQPPLFPPATPPSTSILPSPDQPIAPKGVFSLGGVATRNEPADWGLGLSSSGWPAALADPAQATIRAAAGEGLPGR